MALMSLSWGKARAEPPGQMAFLTASPVILPKSHTLHLGKGLMLFSSFFPQTPKFFKFIRRNASFNTGLPSDACGDCFTEVSSDEHLPKMTFNQAKTQSHLKVRVRSSPLLNSIGPVFFPSHPCTCNMLEHSNLL